MPHAEFAHQREVFLEAMVMITRDIQGFTVVYLARMRA